MKSKNREWFILALSRLALLSDTFQGNIKKACIVSNNVCYGPMPKSDREVKQHLTINEREVYGFPVIILELRVSDTKKQEPRILR